MASASAITLCLALRWNAKLPPRKARHHRHHTHIALKSKQELEYLSFPELHEERGIHVYRLSYGFEHPRSAV